MSLISVDGEKVLKATAFKLKSGLLISDSDKMYETDEKTGEKFPVEKVEVYIEPSLIKFWITDCGLLDDLKMRDDIPEYVDRY